LPYETDDALQQKFFVVNIFPKKVGERGGEVETLKFAHACNPYFFNNI
jgi:hypothetical protein